jgi:glycosyltransferase involved in cell wall biosynthesis
VFYIIAGYPILLASFARRAAPPVQKDRGFRTTVPVLLAVRNGEEFIRGKLECLLGLDSPAHLMEILVVSEGSTDATEAIAESFAGRGVRLIRASRAGNAAAVNAALRHASGEILFFTDVRQPLDADALSHLVANFADTLSDDVVIPPRAFFRGYRVVVDPEAMAFDCPTPEGGEFRRKLRTLAGVWQVHVRLPELFTSANRMRFDFLSHRFGRLVLPWAILLVWAATLALPASPLRSFLLIDELALVALAALDYLVPKGFFLKRVSSPARSFLAMNLASLLAIGVFVVPPETLWRPTRVKVRRP